MKIEEITSSDYKYGFTTQIETDTIASGLNEEVIRLISSKKEEPEWLLDFRLKSFRYWQKMKSPTWAHLDIPEIDFQKISYYAAPRKNAPKSLDEVDPELLKTFEKLGIPLEEQKTLSGIAVDAVMDKVAEEMIAYDPNASVLWLEESGHMGFYEEPEKCAEAIINMIIKA